MRSSIRSGTVILIIATTWLLPAGAIDAGSAAGASRLDASWEILTAQDAATRVRSLYFDESHAVGVSEGGKLIERFPESSELQAWYLMNEARQFMVDDAIRGATALTVERPSDPWSWFALAGTSTLSWERRLESLKLSRKALAMAPNHPDFLWLRAMALKGGKKPAR